jgi:toxin-antitoxin system PIN domain toxin
MRLVDANVLLYAVNRASVHHRDARRWLDTALTSQEAVGFAWITLLAFLRLGTHPAIFSRPMSLPVAVEIARDWLAQPAALVVEPTPRHLDILAGLLGSSGTAGNLVSDAHLATLAIEHDAVVVTFDAEFGRFAGVRWEQPAAGG